jgi:transposase
MQTVNACIEVDTQNRSTGCGSDLQMRPVWEKRGLFLFYIPPYSPHLNIAETLWRVMKGKWLRPQDYACANTLFYATNRALAAIGKVLKIKYNHYAA